MRRPMSRGCKHGGLRKRGEGAVQLPAHKGSGLRDVIRLTVPQNCESRAVLKAVGRAACDLGVSLSRASEDQRQRRRPLTGRQPGLGVNEGSSKVGWRTSPWSAIDRSRLKHSELKHGSMLP